MPSGGSRPPPAPLPRGSALHRLLADLLTGFALTGCVERDAPAFLLQHGCAGTAAHSAAVAREAARLARLYSVDEARSVQAAWLHDISAVFPGPDRARVADALGLLVLPEERAFPSILHQKLAVVLARELFAVSESPVLEAIGCHTTLRAGATPLDMVVFVADKLAWDQPGEPPYLTELVAALGRSLEAASLTYLDYLWWHKASLRVVHPWLIAARADLQRTLGGTSPCP